MSENLSEDVIHFFETIDRYYQCKTEVNQGLSTRFDYENTERISWNLSEFDLLRSAYRKNGDMFMLEGTSNYLELAADKIVSFRNTGRHKYEFVEQYGLETFRITKLRFHNKY